MSARDALAQVKRDLSTCSDPHVPGREVLAAASTVVAEHAPAMVEALEAVATLVQFDECHHTVVDEGGYEGPCDRTAFALRVDPAGGPYPVCIEHAAQGPLLALGQIRDLIETALEPR
jgi:hypothetical protein